METKELLDAAEAATYLGISRRTLWRLRDRGAMPAPVRLGRLGRWRSQDSQKWITTG